jgi:hypothetical protein
LLANDLETIDTKTSVNIYLKNLLHYIHQNFLVAAKFLTSRIVNKQVQNQWINDLKKTIDDRLVKPITNKNIAV